MAKLIQCVIGDEHKIFSVSVGANEEYGLQSEVVLSLPCVIGEGGIGHRLKLSCNAEEMALLRRSAENLEAAYRSITG